MKRRSCSGSRFTPDAPAMTSHQGLYACQAHPLAGLVLFSYPPEHFKYLVNLFIRDTAAVVPDGKDGPIGGLFGVYLDLSGNSRFKVLYRIVEDVAEDHQKGIPVSNYFRQRPYRNRDALCFDHVMQILENRLHYGRDLDEFRLKLLAPQAGKLQDGVYELIQPAGRRVYKSQGFRDILQKCRQQFRTIGFAQR